MRRLRLGFRLETFSGDSGKLKTKIFNRSADEGKLNCFTEPEHERTNKLTKSVFHSIIQQIILYLLVLCRYPALCTIHIMYFVSACVVCRHVGLLAYVMKDFQ